MNSLGLTLSTPETEKYTHILLGNSKHPSVIDLIFMTDNPLFPSPTHSIHDDWQFKSDHLPLLTSILLPSIFQPIVKKWMILRDSEEETAFLYSISLHIQNILAVFNSSSDVYFYANALSHIIDQEWQDNAKTVNICTKSKPWWNTQCSATLKSFQAYKSKANWAKFRWCTWLAKCAFFNKKIKDIAEEDHYPWDLILWISKWNLPPSQSINYNRKSCDELDNLWQALDSSYNSTSNCPVNLNAIKSIDAQSEQLWPPFSNTELFDALNPCANASVPGPDHLS